MTKATNRNRVETFGVSALLLLAATACESTPTSNGVAVRNGASTNPLPQSQGAPVAPSGTSPAATVEGADLAKGQKIYSTACASCHLASGKGEAEHKKDGMPDFTNAAWQKKEPDADLKESIANGKGKIMPAFKAKLSPSDIDLVLRYVRSFPDHGAAPSSAPSGGMNGMHGNDASNAKHP